MRLKPFGLVIFDCDGVLIDSETLSQRLLLDEAASLGWSMSAAELHATTGLTWSALQPLFEQRVGRALPPDWPQTMQDRLIPILAASVQAVPGAREALLAARRLGLEYRIASNSSHAEMREKFTRTGLWPLVEGRIWSARDVARGKPAPDLFLAAAASAGVAPADTLVIEDSAPGVAAALAAGMQVVAYLPPSGAHVRHESPPHHVITALGDLPPLFARFAARRFEAAAS